MRGDVSSALGSRRQDRCPSPRGSVLAGFLSPPLRLRKKSAFMISCFIHQRPCPCQSRLLLDTRVPVLCSQRRGGLLSAGTSWAWASASGFAPGGSSLVPSTRRPHAPSLTHKMSVLIRGPCTMVTRAAETSGGAGTELRRLQNRINNVEREKCPGVDFARK